jgi:hypothetical protein
VGEARRRRGSCLLDLLDLLDLLQLLQLLLLHLLLHLLHLRCLLQHLLLHLLGQLQLCCREVALIQVLRTLSMVRLARGCSMKDECRYWALRGHVRWALLSHLLLSHGLLSHGRWSLRRHRCRRRRRCWLRGRCLLFARHRRVGRCCRLLRWWL